MFLETKLIEVREGSQSDPGLEDGEGAKEPS